jgi:hypothetical protein
MPSPSLPGQPSGAAPSPRGRARRFPARAILLAATSVLAACEDEAAPTGPSGPPDQLAINELVTVGPLNATSSDTLLHFSLARGTVVPSTGAWDIAFRRYEVRLNSPAVTGAASRNVLAHAIAENAAATNADILALTPEGTRAAFDAIRAPQIPADAQFAGDELAQNPQGYLTFGGVPTANAARWWKVRTASGGFAAFRVSAIAFTPQQQVASLTLEVRVQQGGALGAPQSLVVPSPTAPVHLSLAALQAVTPNGCNWDLQFNPAPTALTLGTNTPCGAGTYPGPASPAFAAATSASDAPQYVGYLSVLSGPIPNSITDTRAPFRYNLTGTQRLHPSFNTYLVKVGAEVYKLQLINYYNEAGAAGWPTIRYARIR